MPRKEYKQLNCRDAGMDCDFMVRAETEEEVLAAAASHGSRVHGLKEIPAEKKAKIQSAIKTVRL